MGAPFVSFLTRAGDVTVIIPVSHVIGTHMVERKLINLSEAVLLQGLMDRLDVMNAVMGIDATIQPIMTVITVLFV